jgi:membrane protein implicated in regulation of membrane protease activity
MRLQHCGQLAALAIVIAAFLDLSAPAFAYVGPGAGLTLLGALWGLIVAVVLSVGFVILWPFRKMLRRRHPAKDDQSDAGQ